MDLLFTFYQSSDIFPLNIIPHLWYILIHVDIVHKTVWMVVTVSCTLCMNVWFDRDSLDLTFLTLAGP